MDKRTTYIALLSSNEEYQSIQQEMAEIEENFAIAQPRPSVMAVFFCVIEGGTRENKEEERSHLVDLGAQLANLFFQTRDTARFDICQQRNAMMFLRETKDLRF